MACGVGALLLLVKAGGGARNILAGLKSSAATRWVRGAGATFAEKERTTTPGNHHHRHVNLNLRALGMRAVIASLRSSRICLRHSAQCATHAGFQCRSVNFAGHAVCRPLRRPLSLVQHRQLHSHLQEPTIYALSTASGKAAIAVIRISGPACRQVRRDVMCALFDILTPIRYTKGSVPQLRFRSLAMPPSASCTALTNRRRPRRCSTPAPSSSTSRAPTLSLAKTCSSCTSMAVLL